MDIDTGSVWKRLDGKRKACRELALKQTDADLSKALSALTQLAYQSQPFMGDAVFTSALKLVESNCGIPDSLKTRLVDSLMKDEIHPRFVDGIVSLALHDLVSNEFVSEIHHVVTTNSAESQTGRQEDAGDDHSANPELAGVPLPETRCSQAPKNEKPTKARDLRIHHFNRKRFVVELVGGVGKLNEVRSGVRWDLLCFWGILMLLAIGFPFLVKHSPHFFKLHLPNFERDNAESLAISSVGVSSVFAVVTAAGIYKNTKRSASIDPRSALMITAVALMGIVFAAAVCLALVSLIAPNALSIANDPITKLYLHMGAVWTILAVFAFIDFILVKAFQSYQMKQDYARAFFFVDVPILLSQTLLIALALNLNVGTRDFFIVKDFLCGAVATQMLASCTIFAVINSNAFDWCVIHWSRNTRF